MHPHIMVEMTDRPNNTQNIIVTMSNNEMIIEICRKNALRENLKSCKKCSFVMVGVMGDSL